MYAAPGDAGIGPATERAMRLLKGCAAALAAQPQGGSALPALAVPRNCMIARYPGTGAAYVAHRDNDPDRRSPNRNRRALTAILYANAPDWDVARDGGALRCHLAAPLADEDGCTAACAAGCVWRGNAPQLPSGTCHVDIAPLPGRLVLFRSDVLLHEVRATHQAAATHGPLAMPVRGRLS